MKNLKEIISQQDTVTPCVLNPLFLRHKSSGPFACIHPSDHQVADEKGCYGHANNVYYGRNPLRQQRGEQVISHLHEDEMTQINAEGHGCTFERTGEEGILSFCIQTKTGNVIINTLMPPKSHTISR